MKLIAGEICRYVAVDDDGRYIHISRMFDFRGEDTRNPKAAFSAVFPRTDGKWGATTLDGFEVFWVH